MTALSGKTPSDAELLAAIAAGDRGAFEVFYRRYAAWLVLRLRYRCADDALVDDVVQETFLAIWRRSARYREQQGGDVPGWLWRIGSRRLVDAWAALLIAAVIGFIWVSREPRPRGKTIRS